MPSYHDELKVLAESIGSDGCSGPALQVRVECCWEHDIGYALGTTPRGVPITKKKADQRFRDCNVAHSPLKFLSPLAWWRWSAVHWFGRMHVTPITRTPITPDVLQIMARAMAPALQDRLVEARAARERILRQP